MDRDVVDHRSVTAAPHQCLIAEIRYDDTPIPNGASGTTSDKLAQRNIAWIDGPNPGAPPSRVMPHPFEIRASAAGPPDLDELLVSWGNTPAGSTASFYLPVLDAAEIVSLADGMYRTHRLVATEQHVISCPAEGVTFLPVPAGTGHYAGLLSVDLPEGIRRGDSYDVAVQQVTRSRINRRGKAPSLALEGGSAAGSGTVQLDWRQLRGAFQVRIPITVKEDLLYSEERLLAWLRWRISVAEPSTRWYPILKRYEELIAGRVLGFGGDPGQILPSPNGDVPGHKHPRGGAHEFPEFGDEFTGKVIAVFYDRFGDFEGFTLRLLSGRERTFRGREPAVEQLVKHAWIERTLISVLVDDHRPDWPASIVLRRAERP